MCRLLGYIGEPIILEDILLKPAHSLLVQSYQPRELREALLNADGFGFGWYHPHKETKPFTYKNTHPIWSDINVPHLCRYVESSNILAYVRSATPGQPVDLSNCQPFTFDNWMFVHNGYIEKFRQTLYRPMRVRLGDLAYQSINGNTDSEHIFALLLNELTSENKVAHVAALHITLNTIKELAGNFRLTPEHDYGLKVLANTIFTDGQELIASRFGCNTIAPSLYWLRTDKVAGIDQLVPPSVIVASEPLFPGQWETVPENTIMRVNKNLGIDFYSL